MFETQKSRNKTSSGEIGLNTRILASPKIGQDQVFGGVSVLCWHATPVAIIVLWKYLAIRYKVIPDIAEFRTDYFQIWINNKEKVVNYTYIAIFKLSMNKK